MAANRLFTLRWALQRLSASKGIRSQGEHLETLSLRGTCTTKRSPWCSDCFATLALTERCQMAGNASIGQRGVAPKARPTC